MENVVYREMWYEKFDAPLIFKAIEFSVKAHEGQYRKGLRVPYVYHPMDVGRILMDIECPTEIVVAGILHDTVEDTHVTLEELRENFGPTVAGLVEEASEPDEIISWEERKNYTIEHLKTVSEEALYVICADKFDNIRSIRLDMEKMGSSLWDHFSRPIEAQQWYYESIAQVMESRIKEEPLLSLLQRYKREMQKVFGNLFNK